ncbi:transcription elongation factor TFIIS, partial [Conglomerata obtusa]
MQMNNENNTEQKNFSNIIKKYCNKDSMNNKLIVMFFEAIVSNVQTCDAERAGSLAQSIVEELIDSGKINDRTIVRSKIWNLKDKENVLLCQNVYNGIFSPKKYVEMTNEEMKSADLKKKEEFVLQESLFDVQAPKLEAETDIFKCGKCKQRKTTYYQLQTRSADEPMTTFVT